MDNNDIMRRMRYVFNFNDSQMISLFSKADSDVTRAQISAWLKQEDDPDFIECKDVILATFLNGFIYERRGKQEGSVKPPETRLNNNLILRKLKIALNFKDEDMITTMSKAGIRMSKGELSALFRKPSHKHYRACKDQFLRNFLSGLQMTYRPKMVPDESDVWIKAIEKAKKLKDV